MTDRGRLSADQVTVLLQPIRANRVYTAQGQSHVPAYDITAHLTRVFGFDGWDKEVVALDLVHEHVQGEGKGARAWVTYRCVLRLTVRDMNGLVVKVIEEAATGSAQNQPGVGDAHDFAVKNAVSYALKRCAKDLGDQFGLSLYNKGNRGALVGKTLVSRADTDTPAGPVDEHVEQVDGEGVDPTTPGATPTPPPASTATNPSDAAQAEERERAAAEGVTVAELRARERHAAGRAVAKTARATLRAVTNPEPDVEADVEVKGVDSVVVFDRIRALPADVKADVKAFAKANGLTVTPASLTPAGAVLLDEWLKERDL